MVRRKSRPPWRTSRNACARPDDPAKAADADYADDSIHKRAYGAPHDWVVAYVTRWRTILRDEIERARVFETARRQLIAVTPREHPDRTTIIEAVRSLSPPTRIVFVVRREDLDRWELDVVRERVPHGIKTDNDQSWVPMAALLLT